MGGIHKNGKEFDDGIVRYYDPSKHKWVSEDEINQENTAEKITSAIVIIGAAIICGGGFLYMVIETFG